MEGSFPLSINDNRCSPFITDRMGKTFFHSLPSNSVHCTGVKWVLVKAFGSEEKYLVQVFFVTIMKLLHNKAL